MQLCKFLIGADQSGIDTDMAPDIPHEAIA